MMSAAETTASNEFLMGLASVRIETMADQSDGGYVYTMGHGRLGRPDLIAVCGGEVDALDPPLDPVQLDAEVKAAVKLVRWIVDQWGRLAVLPGAMFRSDTHRIYKVADEETTRALVEDVLRSMSEEDLRFDAHIDYPRVLVPIGRVRWH
jgi:hypothetical protein